MDVEVGVAGDLEAGGGRPCCILGVREMMMVVKIITEIA